jgi:hypothetical protein
MKMAFYFLLFCVIIPRFTFALQLAYSDNYHFHKHVGKLLDENVEHQKLMRRVT